MVSGLLEKIIDFDIAGLHYINIGLSNGWLDFFMPFITQLGSIYFVLIFLLVLTLAKKSKLMAMTGIAYGINVIAFQMMKHLIGRERPFVTQEVNLRALSLFTDYTGVIYGVNLSFPSAHAASAFLLASLLAYYAKSYRLIFYFMAAAVGVSRVYLGVHYPSDVVAGIVLGTVIARLCLGSDYLRQKVLGEERVPAEPQL